MNHKQTSEERAYSFPYLKLWTRLENHCWPLLQPLRSPHLSLHPMLKDPTTEKSIAIDPHARPQWPQLFLRILEKETLAINYLYAFHLLICGGVISHDLGGATRCGGTRVTCSCQHWNPRLAKAVSTLTDSSLATTSILHRLHPSLFHLILYLINTGITPNPSLVLI